MDIVYEAYNINRDPEVITDYFISTVTHTAGCPQADLGTENGTNLPLCR